MSATGGTDGERVSNLLPSRPHADRFAGVPYALGWSGAPLIDGAVAWFERNQVPGGQGPRRLRSARGLAPQRRQRLPGELPDLERASDALGIAGCQARGADRIDLRHGVLNADRLDYAVEVCGPVVAQVEQSARALQRVWDKSRELAGLSDEDVEELAKNSASDQSDDSTSD